MSWWFRCGSIVVFFFNSVGDYLPQSLLQIHIWLIHVVALNIDITLKVQHKTYRCWNTILRILRIHPPGWGWPTDTRYENDHPQKVSTKIPLIPSYPSKRKTWRYEDNMAKTVQTPNPPPPTPSVKQLSFLLPSGENPPQGKGWNIKYRQQSSNGKKYKIFMSRANAA